jgi:hypothetical protein
MMKKFLLLAMITALSLSLAYLPPATAADLSDIAGTQFEKQIRKLVESGVVAGFPDGSFKPNQEVTRAQFAKLAAVALNLNPSGYSQSTFSDVPADHWALGFIEAVAAKGWVKGYPDGTYAPEKNITREEIATMVIRVLGREEEGKAYQEAFVQANDCAKVSDWAYGSVTLAYHSDVQVLTFHAGRMIDPQTPATRGETANGIYFTMRPPVQGGQLTIGMTQEPAKLYPYHNNMHAKSEILSCILAGGNYSSWIGLQSSRTRI